MEYLELWGDVYDLLLSKIKFNGYSVLEINFTTIYLHYWTVCTLRNGSSDKFDVMFPANKKKQIELYKTSFTNICVYING